MPSTIAPIIKSPLAPVSRLAFPSAPCRKPCRRARPHDVAGIADAAHRPAFRCWLLPLREAARQGRERFGHATPLGSAFLTTNFERWGNSMAPDVSGVLRNVAREALKNAGGGAPTPKSKSGPFSGAKGIVAGMGLAAAAPLAKKGVDAVRGNGKPSGKSGGLAKKAASMAGDRVGSQLKDAVSSKVDEAGGGGGVVKGAAGGLLPVGGSGDGGGGGSKGGV